MHISHTVNSSARLADQGRVLEGVADKPFFFTSCLRSLYLFATVSLTQEKKVIEWNSAMLSVFKKFQDYLLS